LESVPAVEQTDSAFGNALQFATDLASLLPEPEKAGCQRKLRWSGTTVVVLHAIYEQMLFDKQRIIVGAGKTVSITLQNDDAMPHNLAVLSPGALEEIGQACRKNACRTGPSGPSLCPGVRQGFVRNPNGSSRSARWIDLHRPC